jgi:hypothetical protein
MQRYAAGTSSHQSSVHGMGEQHQVDTPQSLARQPGDTQHLQSPLGAAPNTTQPAKLSNNLAPLIPDGPPLAPDTQQADATRQWIVHLNTNPQTRRRAHWWGYKWARTEGRK